MHMYTSVDLFCGAGGLTEGFRQAGFHCLLANDFEATAVETFSANHAEARAICAPIEELDPDAERTALGLAIGELDCLVGGSPCQGFSINAPERFLDDPRNSLFRHYVRFLRAFQPKTLVFENVPGMLSLADGHIFRQIGTEFRKLGYELTTHILFAAHYGVPQERHRLIILGSKVGSAPEPPAPTHYYVSRTNFTGGSRMTVRPPAYCAELLPAPPTVHEAIGDLPELIVGAGSDPSTYDRLPHSDFARSMRQGVADLTHHVAPRLAPINLERMKHVPPGGSWRDIPFDLLPSGMRRAKRSDHTRRYGRLHPDRLSGTIMTKVDPHWGAAFHYAQNRTLTVREAARIQSFPDHYKFSGSRVDQYRQVGNAVPVLLARAIAGAIANSLEGQPLQSRLFERTVVHAH
jgi:DNA (cytosine-5)-methyltransferase 1